MLRTPQIDPCHNAGTTKLGIMLAVMKPLADVLLVEDNPADVDLTREVLTETNHHLRLSAVQDGEQAISFLRRRGKFSDVPRPDIIVLDLNLPGITGRNVLQQLKSDQDLKRIPVIIFTSSQAQDDVVSTYELGASCYLRKPGNLPEFKAVVKTVADFWVRFCSQPNRVRC